MLHGYFDLYLIDLYSIEKEARLQRFKKKMVVFFCESVFYITIYILQ